MRPTLAAIGSVHTNLKENTSAISLEQRGHRPGTWHKRIWHLSKNLVNPVPGNRRNYHLWIDHAPLGTKNLGEPKWGTHARQSERSWAISDTTPENNTRRGPFQANTAPALSVENQHFPHEGRGVMGGCAMTRARRCSAFPEARL